MLSGQPPARPSVMILEISSLESINPKITTYRAG